jgi:hypothetical protein
MNVSLLHYIFIRKLMQVIKGGKEAFACFSFFADNILKSNPRIYTITVHYHSGAITRIGSRHTI